MRWDGLLKHLWSIGCRGRVFRLFESYLSDRYIRVVTPLDSSDLYPVSAGVPQGAIWSPSLFNLYVRLLPSVPKHCSVVGYADDHTLLTIIPNKVNRITAAVNLNADLAALCEYGHHWNIKFAPHKTFSLLISLKSDISNHPPLLLNETYIPEISSVRILGFLFDSSLTWQEHIDSALSRGKQYLGQLYRCRSLLGSHGIATAYKSWIRPMLEYGSILYSGAAMTHLNRLDSFQARIENMCGITFPPLTNCRNASILGLTCRLLAGEGRGNLQIFCPKFRSPSFRTSDRLHNYDPASHLRLQNPCNFRTLDRFRRSWQAAIVTLWDSIPASILIQGKSQGWRTVLKDIQRFIMNI